MHDLMKRTMQVVGLLMISSATMGFLATCGKTTVSSGLSDRQLTEICNLWVPISWDDSDSDETIVEVKVNNAKNVAFCPENAPR